MTERSTRRSLPQFGRDRGIPDHIRKSSLGGAACPPSGGDQSDPDQSPAGQSELNDHGSWPKNFPWASAVRAVLLLLMTIGLLAGDWTLDRSRPQQTALAQAQGFTIVVYDYTGRWGTKVETGVQRWDAGLAARGIRLSYSRQAATACESLIAPTYGISVCDTTIAYADGRAADGEHQGIWATGNGIQVRGLVRFYRAAPTSSYADMLVCHEIGHTLQLVHVATGSDSCMTSIPKLITPSAWDIANALSTIPSHVVEVGGDADLQKQKSNTKAKNDGKKSQKSKNGGKNGKKPGKKHRH